MILEHTLADEILGTFSVGQRGTSRQAIPDKAWAAGKQPIGRL